MPAFFQRLFARMMAIFGHRRHDADLLQELAQHFEMLMEDNLRKGLSPVEARRQARISLGGTDQIKEAVRDTRGLPWLEELWRDVIFGCRQLRKAPGFTITAILVLALGIGANTAVFSVIEAVLLRPLPFPHQEELVILNESTSTFAVRGMSYPAFNDTLTHNGSFSGVGFCAQRSAVLQTTSGPIKIRNSPVSHQVFGLLGISPLAGRFFSSEDDRYGAVPTAVISESLWETLFARRPEALGATLQMDGQSYTIIGVVPQRMAFPSAETRVWVPADLSKEVYAFKHRHQFAGMVIARLKPGVSIKQADAEFRGFYARIAREFPTECGHKTGTVSSYVDRIVGNVRTSLLVLWGAAASVLMIACCNVANLQLAHATARSRELAIRAALGAGRWRIVRQLLVESVVLGAAGCVAGLGVGLSGISLLRLMLDSTVPRASDLQLNGWVMGFSVVVSLIASIGIGLIPALQATRISSRSGLQHAGRIVDSRQGNRWRSALVLGEFALTGALLFGTMLMVRTFQHMQAADPGFRWEGTLSVPLYLPVTPYADNALRFDIVRRLQARLAQVPGAAIVGFGNALPLGGTDTRWFNTEDAPPRRVDEKVSADLRIVDGDYFDVFDIRPTAGRVLNASDLSTSPRAVVIDTLLAERYFPGRDPVGRRMFFSATAPEKDSDWWTIVGVVPHVHSDGLSGRSGSGTPVEQVYIPCTQEMPLGGSLVLRSKGDTRMLAPSIAAVFKEIVPDLPPPEIRMADDLYESLQTPRRITLNLLSVFAGLAALLAAVGLGGVLGYHVKLRTREIGVRLALGAMPSTIIRLITGEGLRLAIGGTLLGFAGAVGLTHFLKSLLYEVSPFDPLSFAIVACMVVVIGIVACWIPARRAARVNPTEALRAE